MKAQGTPLKDAKIVFFGAGSSAVGVAKSIASVIELKGGVPPEQAKKVVGQHTETRIWVYFRGSRSMQHGQTSLQAMHWS